MKVLYVVNALDNKYVDFHSIQITDENENEFITIDRINIENYVHSFPKDKINVELDCAYVTDKLDKERLRIQIDRIYSELKKIYLSNGETQSNEVNEKYYKSSIDLLKKCVTPEEYEAQGLDKKDRKELVDNFKIFFN